MDQPAERQVAAPWAVRRPPRSDAELRERPARGILPGWTALLALLGAAALALLVQARRESGLPTWIPGGRAMHDSGPVIDERPAFALLVVCGVVAAVAFGGLMANPMGTARVLSRWGGYRGTVRRSGLLWVNPLLKRRPVDVRIRHWRSEAIHATDREGSPITTELIIVWQVKDTARARFAVDDHGAHLALSAESVFARTASTLPCDSFASPGPSLRDGQWLGGELTRLLGAEMAPVGVAVYSVQAVSLGYRPDFADSMRRRRLAELDAGTREVIIGDAVETAALTLRQFERSQGLNLDDTFRAELTRDLVTAFLSVKVPSRGSAAGESGGTAGASGESGKGAADAEGASTEGAARPRPGSATAVPDAGLLEETGRLTVPQRSATALSSTALSSTALSSRDRRAPGRARTAVEPTSVELSAEVGADPDAGPSAAPSVAPGAGASAATLAAHLAPPVPPAPPAPPAPRQQPVVDLP